MMDKNEVKKDLYKSKEVAEFSRYISGNLYYKVKVGFDVYEFPIPTVDSADSHTFHEDTYWLSSDLGTTTFEPKMKGSDLNRWIGKAIDNGEFTMIEAVVAPI
jgi:hypothetical protein